MDIPFLMCWSERKTLLQKLRVFGIFAVPCGFRHSSLQTWVMEEDNRDSFKQVDFWGRELELSLLATLFAH